MFISWTAVILIVLMVFLYYWMQHRYSEKMIFCSSLPTGVSTLPLLGHLHHIIFYKDTKAAFINVLKRIGAKDYRFSCLWFGPSPLMFINDPEDIQAVLRNSKALHKGPEYKLLKFCLGEGLLTAEVPTWKITRRYMTTMFQPQNLEYLVPVFNNTSRQLIKQLNNKKLNEPIDISPNLRDCTIRNTLCLIFGSQFEGELDLGAVNEVRGTLRLVSILTGARIVKFWLRWDTVFYILYNKQIKQLSNLICRMAESAIKVMAEYDATLYQNNGHVCLDGKDTPPHRQRQEGDKYPVTLPELYKTLQTEHFQITKNYMIDEMFTIFVTGTDSTSVCLFTCVLALAAHPHIQTKLYNEICEEVGEGAGMVTSEDVSKLQYMDCVLKETLRRFTVAPYITRTIESEIKLGDYTIPAGTNFSINIKGIHDNPRLFPDPERFDPDRFTDDNKNQRHKYAFIPFSGGARDCIGRKYAWLTIKIVLVHLLREYKITTTVDINKICFTYDIVLLPKDTPPVTLERRQ